LTEPARHPDPADQAATGAQSQPGDYYAKSAEDELPFFFMGEYDLLVDDKNRLLFPADVRKEFVADRDGPGLVILTGPNGKLWIYPERYYKAKIAKVRPTPVPDPTHVRYGLVLHSRMGKMVPDKQGRALLPENAVDRKKLGREVTLVGNHDHLQLWNRKEWQEFIRVEQERAEQLAAEFAAKHEL